MKVRNTILRFSLLLFMLVISTAAPVTANESNVRAVVQTAFNQLKSGEFDSLYDLLPSNTKNKISRQRFIQSLTRTRNSYQLDRIEIGSIRVADNIATVDTVMYGRMKKPAEAEGKIVAQQYLVRESGRWRIATGDHATVKRFLAGNTKFAKNFKLTEPRIYAKQNGNWIDVSSLLKTIGNRKL